MITTTKIFEKIIAERVKILKAINHNFWLEVDIYNNYPDLVVEAWETLLTRFAAEEDYLNIATDNDYYKESLLVFSALRR